MYVPRKLFLQVCFFCAVSLYAAVPETPKVERVKPLAADPLKTLPGVFFHEDFESINNLKQSFHDIGDDGGRFCIDGADALSGRRAIKQTYRPLTEFASDEDPGNAGWCWRFFGDNPLTSSIPEEQRQPYTTAVARWYHKFEEGFQPRDGLNFPPKMARMRCFPPGNWSGYYTVLFWIGGDDGHISIERHTRVPMAHREWPPNHYANFNFSDPVNLGRWVHFELRVSLGQGTRSDRVQAWADGLLVCDVANDDVAAGYELYRLNGMSWDCYWNGGSPVSQSRYYDDLVLSTEPVGPLRTGLNPELVKSAFSSPDPEAAQAAWEVEVARAVQRQPVIAETVDGVVTRYRPVDVEATVVWRASVAGGANTVSVDSLSGEFTGPLAGAASLEANVLHLVRVRQQDTAGNWSDWSAWHQGFATTWAQGTPDAGKTLPGGYLAAAEAAALPVDSVPPAIEGTSVPDSVQGGPGPYRITARVSDENLLYVRLYYRLAGSEDYGYLFMEEEEGVFAAEIPGFPAGSTVEFYIRAKDLQDNYRYDPPDYQAAPYSFPVVEVVQEKTSCDFNRDGKVGITDVIALLLAGRSDPQDPAVDYNRDGAYSVADAIALLLDILTGNCLVAGI
ncbi:MAG: hypothetical protein JXQ83_07485 [Candidatus Glassbacteria bacterium]|nr:hypothetical protein [Candidatus Glassbacteria bacterium]